MGKTLIYTVSGLTILTVLAVLASNLFPEVIGNENFRTWGLAAVLAEIIGLFILIIRNSLKVKQVNVFLTLPENIHNTTGNIVWDSQSCFVVSSNFKEKIQLLKSDIGPGYKVHFDKTVSEKINGVDVIEFELKEESGRKWRVGPFSMYEKTRSLEPNLSPQQVLESNLNLNYD